MNGLYLNARVLFTISHCEKCSIWNSFIQRINSQIEYGKRIRVIDSTLFNKRGIFTHPLQKVFDKLIDEFPVLFFDGMRIDGAHTRVEAEAFIRSALHEDFIVEPTNNFIFDKECSYIKKGLFKRKTLICK